MCELFGFAEGTKFMLKGRNVLPGPVLVTLALARFSNRGTLWLLEKVLRYKGQTISKAHLLFVELLLPAATRLLENFHPVLHSRERIVEYAAALRRKGFPLKGVWGFIDGVKVNINAIWAKVSVSV